MYNLPEETPARLKNLISGTEVTNSAETEYIKEFLNLVATKYVKEFATHSSNT